MMGLDTSAFPPRLAATRVAADGHIRTHAFQALQDSRLRDADFANEQTGSMQRSLPTNDAIGPRVTFAHSRSAGYGSGGDDDSSPQAAPGGLPQFSRNHVADVPTAQLSSRAAAVPSSSNNSQESNSTNDNDLVFTPPPVSDDSVSAGNGNGQDSSQESQLLQLSQIAASRAKPVDSGSLERADSGMPRKRTADGAVKLTRSGSGESLGPENGSGGVDRGGGGGHSRNTSTVSMASTSSRIGELSAELKARLSYAMVKVNHGWQSHSIDQVESLASQAASPTSSSSTIHFRQGSSASPQLSDASRRGSGASALALAGQHYHNTHGEPADLQLREINRPRMLPPPNGASPNMTSGTSPSLAPPVSIEPARPTVKTRRNSNPKYTPTFLSHAHPHHASPSTGPSTPAQPATFRNSHAHGLGVPFGDPILFSPHQNVREQDAIESLLFMSSPGNSTNLKHAFPPSPSQPLPAGHERNSGQHQRRALPTSQPRRSLPSGRPISQSQPQPRRVGFGNSPSYATEMDVDEAPPGTPRSRGTPKRKVNGSSQPPMPTHDSHIASRLKPLPVSSGLAAPMNTRPALADEDIERMLDRANDDSSDSEGEIEIPTARSRREVADGVRV